MRASIIYPPRDQIERQAKRTRRGPLRVAQQRAPDCLERNAVLQSQRGDNRAISCRCLGVAPAFVIREEDFGGTAIGNREIVAVYDMPRQLKLNVSLARRFGSRERVMAAPVALGRDVG